MEQRTKANRLVLSALIAALYAGITLLTPMISYQNIQVRVAEAFTVLPILFPEAIPGIALGCLVSNFLSPYSLGWIDVVFGTLATLVAAIVTYKLRKKPYLAIAAPVVFNGLIVGAYLPFLLHLQITTFAIPLSMLTVAAGEIVACYGLGLLLLKGLQKTKLFN